MCEGILTLYELVKMSNSSKTINSFFTGVNAGSATWVRLFNTFADMKKIINELDCVP